MDDRPGRPRTLPALAAQPPPSAAPHSSAPMARADAKRARGLRALQGRVQPESSERFSAVGPAGGSGGPRGAAPAAPNAAQKRSTTASFAHIFFNRRPLELLKRTSTLLTAGGRSASRGDGKSAAGAMGPAPMPLPQATESSARPPVPATTVRVRADPAVGEHIPSTQHLPDSEYRQLTPYERHEVKAYDRVLYCSTLRLKAQRRGGQVVAALPVHPDDEDEDEDPALEDAALERELPNFGFDDPQGDYLVVLGDHLAFRYEVQRALGRGAFGQVVECTDHATQRRVAVKIVRNRPKYAAQAAVEAQLLARVAHSNAHNVVRFLERFTFRRHVCLVFELLGPNLYDALRLRFFKGFPMRTVRGVARQLVLALRSLQELDVVHCDLKPENVLICSHVADDTNDECSHVSCSHVTYDTRSDQAMDVKLIDFGSACMPTAGAMFTYVQSRFYRSPEVLLGHAYSTPIDMWSLACVLAELHAGHPLFAGENETEQLHCILEVLGAPPAAFLEQCKRRRQFFDEVNGGGFVAKPFVNSRGRRRVVNSRSLKAAAQSDDAAFLAFLARCLEWDPARRLTPHEALLDPWLARD